MLYSCVTVSERLCRMKAACNLWLCKEIKDIFCNRNAQLLHKDEAVSRCVGERVYCEFCVSEIFSTVERWKIVSKHWYWRWNILREETINYFVVGKFLSVKCMTLYAIVVASVCSVSFWEISPLITFAIKHWLDRKWLTCPWWIAFYIAILWLVDW